jgi:hypothetical protein
LFHEGDVFEMDTNGPLGRRLDALRKREAEIRAKIASENEKLRRKSARDRARLESLLGAALLDAAEKSPDFRLVLTQVLNTSITDERERRLLASGGLI